MATHPHTMSRRCLALTIIAMIAVLFVACEKRQPQPPAASDAQAQVQTQTPMQTPEASAPKSASKPEHVVAIGDTSQLSVELQRAFDPASDFAPMGKPGPNDWLAQHPEDPQTYDGYVASAPRIPDATHRIIYLLPIGDFAVGTSLASLAEIVRAFFQVEVRILPAVRVAQLTTVTTRINESTKKRQLLAPDVLTWLAPKLPADGYALMAATMEDLYPDPTWNFVFGMASSRQRVGVQSFARQDASFFGNAREAGWEKLLLRRATWTLVHEISHMFGLSHCVHWTCVVAGSNNQAEADSRPLHPCPVCLRKLHYAIKFDPAKREDALAATLRKLGIDDEAAWSERRSKWIREGAR